MSLQSFCLLQVIFFCLSVPESPFISKTCLICPVIIGCLLLSIRGGLNIRVGAVHTGAPFISTGNSKVSVFGSLLSG